MLPACPLLLPTVCSSLLTRHRFPDEDSDDLFEFNTDSGLDDAEPRLARWAARYEDGAALVALDEQGGVYVDAHVLSTPLIAGREVQTEVLRVGTAAQVKQFGCTWDRRKRSFGAVALARAHGDWQ